MPRCHPPTVPPDDDTVRAARGRPGSGRGVGLAAGSEPRRSSAAHHVRSGPATSFVTGPSGAGCPGPALCL
eukprot:670884-Hanusia_phi.AAC.1